MRDIIEKNEGKLTTLRFIGFIMLVLGVVSMIVCSFFKCGFIPSVIAVSFFVTMTGFSLAFPTMLEGSEGLSTMRIVVFMVTSVICMLLLKLGWAASISSLEDIGLDSYWMGVIAFVFGAKATQSFFESKMAVPKASLTNIENGSAYSSAEIARLAVLQNEQFLKVRFPNILSISDVFADPDKDEAHVVVIYLKDNNSEGIPPSLKVRLQNQTETTIDTEVVKGTGIPVVQYSQLNSEVSAESAPLYIGSVCCGVKSLDGKFHGILTSSHIYTQGFYTEVFNGYLNKPQQTNVLVNGTRQGKWYFKMLDNSQDLAIIQLSPGMTQDTNYKSFGNKFHTVTNGDVKTPVANVTMLSKNNKTTEAFILDYNVGLDVQYKNGPSFKTNVILIGSTNDRQTAQPVSRGGDSGSCIFNTANGALIGMLLGRANNFSLVLPIESMLLTLKLQTI